MKTYLTHLLCDAAPEDGPAQQALLAAIMDQQLVLREDNFRHDLHRCQQWLKRRTWSARQRKPATLAA